LCSTEKILKRRERGELPQRSQSGGLLINVGEEKARSQKPEASRHSDARAQRDWRNLLVLDGKNPKTQRTRRTAAEIAERGTPIDVGEEKARSQKPVAKARSQKPAAAF
jgi:hypothetical protein